jgi:hypothetical protein
LEEKPKRIQLGKSGLPILPKSNEPKKPNKSGENRGAPRPKDETPEQRKARKEAAKAYKRVSLVHDT